MAVQIVKPVDTGFPMNPSTVEADTEIEEDFTWISLSCCTYGHYKHTDVDDLEEDIDV